jgi:hypothetical protein
MASETLAFVEEFDSTLSSRSQLLQMLGRDMPILILTDSQSLFNVMTTQKRTTEDRLMIDRYAARQSYCRAEIWNIGLIRSEFNIAENVTRLKGNGALFHAMVSGHLVHPVENYIVQPCEMPAMRYC